MLYAVENSSAKAAMVPTKWLVLRYAGISAVNALTMYCFLLIVERWIVRKIVARKQKYFLAFLYSFFIVYDVVLIVTTNFDTQLTLEVLINISSHQLQVYVYKRGGLFQNNETSQNNPPPFDNMGFRKLFLLRRFPLHFFFAIWGNTVMLLICIVSALLVVACKRK